MSTFDLTRPADSSESEDDDDYVPSAEESEGDPSDAGNDADSDVETAPAKKPKKGKTRATVSRKRRGGMKFDEEAAGCAREASPEASDKAAEDPAEPSGEDKQKADLLWADFLKDVGPLPKKQSPQTQTSATTSNPTSPPKPEPAATPPVEKKVKITKVMNFAGETVLVDKEVDADSKEAQCHAKESASPSGSTAPLLPGIKRPAGAKNVLNQLLNKKQKLSVLEKSRLDWERHKREKGIEEEIQTHNRGKDGYLEKQAFLQRADLRQFEIEKDLRAKRRVTRLV